MNTKYVSKSKNRNTLFKSKHALTWRVGLDLNNVFRFLDFDTDFFSAYFFTAYFLDEFPLLSLRAPFFKKFFYIGQKGPK